MTQKASQPVKVAVIGGGVAALEAMLALDATTFSRADVHLFSPKSEFVLKPLAVSSAFGRGGLLGFDLSRVTATAGTTFHNVSVTRVTPQDRIIDLSDDSEFAYDYLIAAPGAKSLWSVPGAITYWGPAGNQALTEALDTLRGQKDARVVVTMPEGGTWPLPIYELALLLDAELDESASVTVVTPESLPLELFGKSATEKVTAMLGAQHIETVLECAPSEFRDGTLLTTDGREFKADMAITLPLLTGREIPGLPYDDDGFIPVDDFGQIREHSREFAAGDVTSFPVKFGGLAAGQADVVAATIAAAACDQPLPAPFRPVYRGTLITADGPVNLGPDTGNARPFAWDPAEKVQGKYLTPFLKAADPAAFRALD